MTSFTFIDPAEEEALHKSRLLNNEEKNFKRIIRHLLIDKTSVFLTAPPALPPTPPPDASAADELAAEHESQRLKRKEDYEKAREEILLDFAGFESNIERIQFLMKSNEQERERYAGEKIKILSTAQAVRESTAQLRVQLEEAQRQLSLRKSYDELAEKITSNRLLRPREDQEANLHKLNAEIAELQRESQEYAKTWAERREQFGRIVKEGMELRRLIRDEKEEVERREGMEEREEGEEGEVGMQKGSESAVGTPLPDTSGGGATPLHSYQESIGLGRQPSSTLRVPGVRANTVAGDTGSHISSPANLSDKHSVADEDDINMAEQGEITGEEEEEGAIAEEGSANEEEDIPMAEQLDKVEVKVEAGPETGDTMDTT